MFEFMIAHIKRFSGGENAFLNFNNLKGYKRTNFKGLYIGNIESTFM